MKQFIVVVLAVLTTLSPARASLGDGGDRIDDSYGNLIQRRLLDDGRVSVLYHKDRYLYFVIFANGQSVLERYSHANGTDLSEKEIGRFLKANAAGATWLPDNKAKERQFRRSDGGAKATYATTNGRPTLTVREMGSKGDGGDQWFVVGDCLIRCTKVTARSGFANFNFVKAMAWQALNAFSTPKLQPIRHTKSQ